MDGGKDDYYKEDGDFRDAGDSGADFDDDSRYDREMWGDNLDHQLMLNGAPVDGGGKRAGGLNFLRNNEKNASGKPNINGKGGDKNASLGEKEKNVESDGKDSPGIGGKFNNAVRGLKDIKEGNVVGGGKRLRKAGPLATVAAIIVISIAGSFMGQMSLPFSFISQIRESFDSISMSQGIRSKVFLRYQTTNKRNVKGCIKAHYFRPDEFKVSSKQKKKLAAHGITFEEDADGVTVMKHTAPDGTMRTIVADEKLATGDRISFDSLYDSEPSFRNSYDEASRTWRGAVGAWFDSSMRKLLTHLGITGRNKWDGFDSTSEKSADEMKSKIAADADTDDAGGKTRVSEDTEKTSEKTNSDGSTSEKTVTNIHDDSAEKIESDATLKRTDIDGTDTSGLKTKLTSIGSSLASSSSIVVNIACAASDIVGGISAIVAAYQSAQIIKVASSVFEGIQKAQAGDGTESPIHDIGNALTQKVENIYERVKSVKKADGEKFEADEVEKVTRSRSAMEAEAVGAKYGGEAVDPNDPSVRSFNINSVTTTMWNAFNDNSQGVLSSIKRTLTSITSSIDVSAKAFKSCTIARAGAAAIQLGTQVVKTLGECLTMGFPACLVAEGVEAALTGIAKSTLISTVVSTVVSFLVPHVAKVLTRTIATEVVGEDLGNALVFGGNAYMGGNHRYSGGALANKESLVAYLKEKDKVIANEARFERETRSPFDITSKYTFFGSLAAQMIPFASNMTSITSAVKGFGSVIGGAVNSLMPQSSAVNAGIEAQAASDYTAEYCSQVADIGAVAEADCTPYVITDVSTLGNDPAAEVNYNSDQLEDVTDEDGENVPTIKKDSELKKWLIWCGQRTSPFGLADQNIASEVDPTDVDTSNSTVNNVTNSAIGAIPFVGDTVDIISSSKKLKNMGWISGESCVIGNHSEDDAKESVSWETAKHYQRFIEDQRLAEAEGIIEQSAVTKALAEYYEEHPLDNSMEGILARYTGMKKEKVIAMLDFMKVAIFMSEYEPEGLYPYPKQPEEEKTISIENKYHIIDNDMKLQYDTIFDNKRYRNFAA